MADFDASQQHMHHAARRYVPGQIRLIEYIGTYIGVVVSGQGQISGSIDGAAGIDVLVKLVVVRDAEIILDLPVTAKIVIDNTVRAVESRTRTALRGVTKK